MRLWTVQPVEIMDIITNIGVFTCETAKSENYEDFKEAYLWLVAEMDKRNIPHPEGVELPLWAWHTRNWQHKKPDLRNIGLGCKGQKCVCIEFEIEDDKVLLSDYENWHFVLNKWWFDDSTCHEDWEKAHEWYDSLPYDVQNKLMEESWQKVFDVNPEESDWFVKGRYVQATFWELKKDMIKDIRYFTAK